MITYSDTCEAMNCDGSNGYKFGFNAKENDKETGLYDYGFRIYNPSLGRFLSTDPLFKSYPWYTPYQFAGNRPINSIDLDGLEEESYIVHLLKTWLGIKTPSDDADVEEAQQNAHDKKVFQEVLDKVEENSDKIANTVGTVVPFYSAGIEGAKGNYSAALFMGTFDLFGGKIVGGFMKGATKMGFERLFADVVNIPGLLKSASVTSFKFFQGNGTKTAVIGQGMNRVKQLGTGLKNFESFKPSEGAEKAWNKLLEEYKGKQIPDDVVKTTAIYKENVDWIKGVKDAGYDIIDIGEDASGTSSTFYNMEKAEVYGTK